MRVLFLAFLLFGIQHAQAENLESVRICVQLTELSRSIMNMRQNGTPIEATHNLLSTNYESKHGNEKFFQSYRKFVLSTIADAYQKPIAKDRESQKRVADDYANETYADCIEMIYKNKI